MSTKRVEASVSPQKLAVTRQLRNKEIYVSLMFLVGLPYVSAKLTEYWEHVGGGVLVEDEDDLFGDEPSSRPAQAAVLHETPAQQRKRKWEAFFRKAYPYVQVVYQLWMLGYHIGYLFGRTPYWRPWLAAMRVDVRRSMGNEQPLMVGAAAVQFPKFTRYPFLWTYVLMRKGGARILDALKYALPASIFFFKFLEWWYSPNNRRRRGDSSTESSKRIAPPSVLLPSQRGVLYNPPPTFKDPQVLAKVMDTTTLAEADDDMFADGAAPPALLHNACPLCGAAPIQNPCVLATGYACCYTCATEYVDKWHRCPVTMTPLPGGVEQIRRVLV